MVIKPHQIILRILEQNYEQEKGAEGSFTCEVYHFLELHAGTIASRIDRLCMAEKKNNISTRIVHSKHLIRFVKYLIRFVKLV